MTKIAVRWKFGKALDLLYFFLITVPIGAMMTIIGIVLVGMVLLFSPSSDAPTRM